MQSVFIEKEKQPTALSLKNALGSTHSYWKEIEAMAKELQPNATSAWHFTSQKYGWNFRISDKKRVLIYLLPRDQYFKVAFVFGEKAVSEILSSGISNQVKEEIKAAKPYAEGRGIRIDVKVKGVLADIKLLLQIKINH